MHASLKWYAATFGAQFPMDHWATKHFRFHAVHHTGRQAPELEPWEFVNLLLLMKKSQGTHRVLVAQMLMAALGCIRFEHLQRSKFVTTHGPSLEFQCAQGKARKKGARPGYAWGLPHATLDGQGVTQTLLDFYANEYPQTSGFLLPAVSLNPEEFWEVTEHTGLIVNKPMSRSRFLELLRGALYQIGVEFTNAQAAGFNRLRRFIPTIANGAATFHSSRSTKAVAAAVLGRAGLPFVSGALAVCPEDCTSPWRNIKAGQSDPAHGRKMCRG